MAKNLLKKGLSLAAVASLSVTALVGIATPAQAAGELKLEPSAGSLYTVGSADVFTLKTSFNPGYSSSGVTSLLKYKLTQGGVGGFQVDAKAASSATGADLAADTLASAISSSDADKTAVFDADDSAVGYLGLAINSASTSTTYTVDVQAWVDTNGNDTIDSNEWNSNAVTVTFLKYSAYELAIDIVEPVRAATSVTVHVTSPNVNLQQIGVPGTDGVVEVNIAVNGSSVNDVVPLWDAADGRLEGTLSGVTALAAGDLVRASAKVTAEANAHATNVSTFSYATAVQTRTESVATATVTANTAVVEVSGTSGAGAVPEGSGTFVVRSKVTYATGYNSASVTFIISEASANSLQSDSTVTAGGVTLTNTNAGTTQSKDTITVAADAEGYATLSISYTNLDAGDSFTVDSTIQGYSGSALTITARAPVATELSNINAIGVDTDSSELVFATAAAFTLKYAVLDQFGDLLKVAGHTVTVSDGTNSWSGAVVDGYANVTVPAYSAATTKTMTPTVFKNGVDVSLSEPTAEVTISSTVKPATSVTALGSVSSGNTGITSSSKRTLNLEKSVAGDTRIGAAGPVTPTTASGITVSGTARDAALDETITAVTLSAPGLMFEADGVWAIGSITVQTNASGAYTADVYSNLAGKHVVTVTAGTGSVTEELFYADADDNAGKNLVITAPSSVMPGSTLNVVATVTDAFGNPVNTVSTSDSTNDDSSELLGDFKISYTGPGLLVGSTPLETDAAGQAKLGYLLGTNDTGSITVTASYDANGDADYTDTGDLVVTKTITIGASAASTTGKVNVGSFNGKLVVYAQNLDGKRISWKVGGNWGKATAVGNTLNRFDRPTPRRGVTVSVEIYVDGVKQLTKSVVTR